MKSALGLVGALLSLLVVAPSAWSQTPDAAEFQKLIKKARDEGRVVITGPPNPEFSTALSAAFTKRYGIQLEYLPINSAETVTRIDVESRTGHHSIDAIMQGAGSCWILSGRGQIENMNGKLIDPEMLNPKGWRNGHVKLIDAGPVPPGTPPDFRCGFQTAEWVMTDLFVNPTIVKPSEISSWKDLLKTKFKGKISSYDPRRPGPAQITASYLERQFGSQYVKDLYAGQGVRLSSDYRQLADWVVRGETPIALSLVQFAVEPLRAQGLPIERVFPTDGLGAAVGGFSVYDLIKNAPHPNAAQLFANWFGSREAQTIYEKYLMEQSLRSDVKGGTNVPDYVRQKPGITYVDVNTWAFDQKVRVPAVQVITKELQR